MWLLALLGSWVWIAAPTANAGLVPLEDLIMREAKQAIPPEAVDLEIIKLVRPNGLPGKLDPGKTKVVFRRGEDFCGSTLIAIERDGARKRWVHAVLGLKVPSAVAARDLPRGHRLSADDLMEAPVSVDKLPRERRVTADEMVGCILRIDVAAGKPIPAHRLEHPVVVRRGDRVEIRVAAGRVQVRGVGEALGSGRVGDTVSIRRSQRGQKLKARVAGPGLVVVRLGAGR